MRKKLFPKILTQSNFDFTTSFKGTLPVTRLETQKRREFS